MDDRQRAALWKAAAASFLVYLLPVFLPPHAMLLWGRAIVTEMSEWPPGRGSLWLASDLGLALALQAAVLLIFYWVCREPSWRRVLVLVPTAPVLLALLHWMYLSVIPAAFLIEADQSPEKGKWAEECSIADYSLVEIPTAAHESLAKGGQAWVMHNADLYLAMLKMPGCEIAPLDLQWSNVSLRIHHALPDGRSIYSTRDLADNEQKLWFLEGPGSDPLEITQPPYTDYAHHVLSADGVWVGWVQSIRESKDESGEPRVLLQNLATGDEKIVDLNYFAPARFELMAVDMAAPRITLARDHREFLAVDLNGETVWGPLRPDKVKASSQSFRKVDGGWVAWDSYKESGAYRMQWELPAGSGAHRILKGRSIRSVSVDPSGRYIALSVGTSLRIGDVDDSVYVLRSDDGREVFRRYQPPYTRSAVAFLGSKYFAYTEAVSGEMQVRVLQVSW